MIRYHAPNTEERLKIWQVMAAQFRLPLPEELVRQLADQFPNASGRDIKGLAKLVARFCQYRKITPTLAVFEHCAKFRALDSKAVDY